jgi:hypothetical protein
MTAWAHVPAWLSQAISRRKPGNGPTVIYGGTRDFNILMELGMSEFDERLQANMDVVLDEVCAELPNGGNHEERKFVAERLIRCARAGRTTLGELLYTGRRALVELKKKRFSA